MQTPKAERIYKNIKTLNVTSLVASNYGWKSAGKAHSHSYLIPQVIKHLKKRNVQSIIDIGTGNGAAIPEWLSLGLKVAAIEPDDSGYMYAQEYSNADVRKLGVGDKMPDAWRQAFDAVIV